MTIASPDGWDIRLDRACRKARTPGAVLGISVHGKRFVATFGKTRAGAGRQVGRRTIFRLGSMTKLVTSALFMRQVDAGRADLDTPVKQQLPEFTLADQVAEMSVTPRQLLSHTSGFFGDVLEGPSDGDAALEDYVRAGARLEQVTRPGECFSYNNAAFAIIARMTEQVAGRSWSCCFNGDLASLGLERTGAMLSGIPDDDAAASHGMDSSGEAFGVDEFQPGDEALAPAGSRPWTTTDDTLTLAETLLAGGGGWLSEASVRLMATPEVEGPTPVFASRWGLGVQIFNDAPFVFGHDGAVAGQWSFLRILPESGVALCLFLNGGDARAVFADIFAALEGDVGRPLGVRPPAWPEPSPVLDMEARGLCGRYEVSRQSVVVAMCEGALEARLRATGDGGISSPTTVFQLRRQCGEDARGMYLSRLAPYRFPTQHRFRTGADGRQYLWFRGRLLPRLED